VAGVEVHILPTGASIHRLYLPDRDGHVADVALGMGAESSYADGSSPYFGAVAGRFANRIANATFTLNGKTHTLPTNEQGFPGSLHGGKTGFDKVRWQATRMLPDEVSRQLERAPSYRGEKTLEGEGVRLRYRSVDGEEGYPGELTSEVIYVLRNPPADGEGSLGELIQFITATTDAPTVVNLAQHSYFNLAGHDSGRSILGHELTLHDASHYLPVDHHRIPYGHMQPVAGTPFDFTSGARLGAHIEDVHGPGWRAGFDHCFVLHGLGRVDGSGLGGGRAHGGRRRRRHAASAGARPKADEQWWQAQPKDAATLADPSSGRVMHISTTAPGLQLYTSNFLDGTLTRTKDAARYDKYAGVCLETQAFPDGPNRAAPRNADGLGAYPTSILEPGEVYQHHTVYSFATVPQH